MLSPGFHIRSAKEEDIETVLGLVKELAVYEKAEESAKATPELMKQNLFTTPFAHALLVISLEGQAIAFTLYYFNFSTWTGRPGLYLGDLFVKEEYRSKGIGKALFSELAKIAQERNCARMDWTALKWNTLSRNFYEKGLGAQLLNDAICLRPEDGIEKLKNFNNAL